jgi:hypothetical protein
MLKMRMNIKDFMSKYGNIGKDIIDFFTNEDSDFDNSSYSKDDLIEYGEIEIHPDSEDNVINYTLGMSDVGCQKLGLNNINNINNQPIWGTDKLDDILNANLFANDIKSEL